MSIHINDTLINVGSNSTIIVPTNNKSDLISSVDLLSNIGSIGSTTIDQSLLLCLSYWLHL